MAESGPHNRKKGFESLTVHVHLRRFHVSNIRSLLLGLIGLPV